MAPQFRVSASDFSLLSLFFVLAGKNGEKCEGTQATGELLQCAAGIDADALGYLAEQKSSLTY